MNATVTLNTNLKMLADNSSSRYELGSIAVGEKGVAVATQGQALGLTHCDVEGKLESLSRDGWALIPSQILHKPTRKPAQVLLNGRVETDKGKFAEHPAGRFPKVAPVVPELDQVQTTCVTLDAQLLYKLAQAICEPNRHQLTLYIGGPDYPIAVASTSNENCGVIMPYNEPVSMEDYHSRREELLSRLPEQLK